MVEIKGQSVTMLAIGPSAVFPPEMIAMATWYPCSTPYGAYSIADSDNRPVAVGLAADTDSSATPAIGKTGRFSVSFYPPQIWPERRQTLHYRYDGVDWDRWFGSAAAAAAAARVQDQAGSAP